MGCLLFTYFLFIYLCVCVCCFFLTHKSGMRYECIELHCIVCIIIHVCFLSLSIDSGTGNKKWKDKELRWSRAMLLFYHSRRCFCFPNILGLLSKIPPSHLQVWQRRYIVRKWPWRHLLFCHKSSWLQSISVGLSFFLTPD